MKTKWNLTAVRATRRLAVRVSMDGERLGGGEEGGGLGPLELLPLPGYAPAVNIIDLTCPLRQICLSVRPSRFSF